MYINLLHGKDEPSQLTSSTVRFTPGARTHWHSHAKGATNRINNPRNR